jgi:lysozyme family protein
VKLEQALEHVFAEEGGWSDHPADPGGKTNMGVTLRTLRRAVEKGVVAGPVQGESWAERLRRLSRRDAEKVYRVLYWQPARCEHLPEGLDLMAFDAAVNQGVRRAIKFYQKGAGTKADGIWGPKTEAAVQRADPDRLLRDTAVHRALHYSSLSKLAVFGKGWFRRLFRTYAAAIHAQREES